MKYLLTSLALASTLMASNLLKEAQNANLKPIPSSKSELYTLIDTASNPITEAKVRLGKELFLIQDSLKVALLAVIVVIT